MDRRRDNELLCAVELVCSTSSDPIALLDSGGDVSWVNSAFHETYGYTSEEVVGRRLCVVLGSHDPVTLEGVPFTSESMRDGTVESVTRRSDGSPVWVECELRVVSGEEGEFILTLRDTTRRHALVGLHAARSAILTSRANGEPLEEVLDAFVGQIHEHTVGISPSIMLKDPKQDTLGCVTSRGLPVAYQDAIQTIPIGPNEGSCGTAAHTGERQITRDILNDEKWETYRDLARLSKMRACWSEPIMGTHGDVLGTFALYYETPRSPTGQEQEFFQDATNLVREAIERDRHDRVLELERSARARSERRLQQLHDLAPDAIITTNAQRRIVTVNDAAVRMFGWPRDELMGQPIGVLIPPKHKDFHESASKEFINDDKAHLRPRVVTAMHRDGSIISGEASLYYYVEGGERFATAIIRDISERRRLERAHLRESTLRKIIVDHVPSMIYWKDTDLVIQGCNLALAKAVGFESTEDVVGLRTLVKPCWEISNQDENYDETRLLDGEIADHVQELVVSHENGTEHTLSLRTVCLKGGDGEILGLLGICDDLTESRRATQMAMQQQKMEALGRLVGGVAHDFNNLLFVIQSNLELIEDELPPDELVDACVRDAIDATKRGAKLTRQLLSTGRRANLSPSVVDLNETLVSVESMLRRTIPASIEVVIERVGFPCLTRVDVALFETALLNLAINARDAMKRGGILTIGVDEVVLEHEPGGALEAGRYARVYVRDTGEGMTPDVIERAFEPFFTTKPIDEGTGMGLSMVHGFVVQSEGTTRITSEPGAGTTITLFLPIHDDHIDEISDVEFRPHTTETLHIMLVEDDHTVRRALEGVLESMGHQVTALEDALAALEALETMRPLPQAILSDAVMPGAIQGPELSKRVRQLYPGIPVVLMSGYPVLPTSSGEMPDAPIRLSKPFSRTELMAALDETVFAMETIHD